MLKDAVSSTNIITERLGRSEIFKDLSADDLLAIASFCDEESYEEGAAVLVEDEPAQKLFVVERGRLALEKKVQLGRHSTPRNATIGYVGPGQTAGFSTVTEPHVYSTSAVCVEPTRVLTIDGEKLRAYLNAHPEAGFRVMTFLASLVRGRYRHAIGTLTYFLSVVSHELRSPLAAVENYLQVLLSGLAGELSEKQERMIRRCVVRVTDLRSQIGDVVDLARMRAEQIQADFEPFDLSEVGAQAIEDVRLAAAEKDVRIKLERPPVFYPIIGAPRRMRQALTNLLINAIRYSPPGGWVTFRARFEPDEVFFEVEDEGPGIAPDDMPHIFKEFYRSSYVKDTAGMGLGLSITKKIVDAHRGKILVRNLADDEGKTGARFTIVIPRDLRTPEMRRREWSLKDMEEA